MPEYEFRHPLRVFRFTAYDDQEAQAFWFMGLVAQPKAAKETKLFRLSDEPDGDDHDITPSLPDGTYVN